jgi:hypothetical protein
MREVYGGSAPTPTTTADDDEGDVSEAGASERERGKAASNRASASLRTTKIEARLKRALDAGRRQRMLAAIYIMRSDAQPQVCDAAAAAWKALVSNTPATLSEVLPAMLDVVVANVASGSDERRDVAGRALAGLVKKLGDRILPPLLASIRAQLLSGDAAAREGMLLALADVLSAAPTSSVEPHVRAIVGIVRESLCDEDDDVREAAGVAFDQL